MVQQLNHAPPKSATLGPEDQSQVPLPDPIRRLEEILASFGVGPDHPEAPFLELDQGPSQVSDPRDRKMLDCPGTRPGHRSSERRRPARSENEAHCPSGLCHPDDGTEILGILNPIEGQEAPASPKGDKQGLKLLERRHGQRTRFEYQALTPCTRGECGFQPLAGYSLHSDSRGQGELGELLQLHPIQIFLDAEPDQATPLSSQRLENRMQTEDEFGGSSLSHPDRVSRRKPGVGPKMGPAGLGSGSGGGAELGQVREDRAGIVDSRVILDLELQV